MDIKSVAYIQNALLPDCSNVEAAARFTRFIEDSSKFVHKRFTQAYVSLNLFTTFMLTLILVVETGSLL